MEAGQNSAGQVVPTTFGIGLIWAVSKLAGNAPGVAHFEISAANAGARGCARPLRKPGGIPSEPGDVFCSLDTQMMLHLSSELLKVKRE